MTAGILVDVDRFAELTAELDDPFLPRDSTLAKAGLTDADFDTALRHWRERMTADTGPDGVAPRFAEAYSRTRGELTRARQGAPVAEEGAQAARFLSSDVQSFREEAAAVQLLAPVEAASAPPDPLPAATTPVSLSSIPAPKPVVTSTEGPSTPAEVRGSAALPSYLRGGSAREASPWSASAPPALIAPSPPPPPPPLPSSAVARTPVDPEATSDALPRVRAPALPFGNKPSPDFVAAMSAPAIPKDPGGETVMVPAIREAPPGRTLPFAVQSPPKAPPAPTPAKQPPTLTLQQYASLSAELSVAPESTATLSRYGIPDVAAQRELDRAWAARFASEPELRRQWETLVNQYRAWLASSAKR